MFTDNKNIINSKKNIYYELESYNLYYNKGILITDNVSSIDKTRELVEQLKKCGKNGTFVHIIKKDSLYAITRTAFNAKLLSTTLFIDFWTMKNDPALDPGFSTNIKTNKLKQWYVELLDSTLYSSEEL